MEPDVTVRAVVAGEALVDLVPSGDGLVPHPGGSPFNVAVGLGRLEVEVAYLGALSSDAFGDRLAADLAAAGVDLTLAPRVTAPTTLAVVHLDADHRASYGFYLDATSAASLTTADLPTLPDGAMLHVSLGAIGVTHAATGAALVELLRREAGRRLTSFDPNVRPSATVDRDRSVARLEATVAGVDLVKVSDEDLSRLYPGSSADTIATRWAASGPALVVVTRGPGGAFAVGTGARVEVAGRAVDVVDTVGAGDAFTAGLLSHLDATGSASRAALDDADGDAIAAALEHAVRVAAITCTRSGADPPTAAESAG